MAVAPSIDYGDLGWIKIFDYPYWPIRRADITEAPLDVRKLGREELMLVYFFGVHSYAWVSPEKAQLWDEAIEKQNEAQRRGKLLQSALDEAYEWQKDFLKKKFSTRRRSSAQPNEKRSDVPASLMSEIKAYRRTLDQFMKFQDKEWRESRKKIAAEELFIEPTPNAAIVSPENVLPADSPKRTAKIVAADLLNMSATLDGYGKLSRKPKSPIRKVPKKAASAKAAASSIPLSSSSSSQITAPPSAADVVAEMLKTEESDGALESLVAFASVVESTAAPLETQTTAPTDAMQVDPPAAEPTEDAPASESLPAPDPVTIPSISISPSTGIQRGGGRRRGSARRGGKRGGKRSFSSPHGPASSTAGIDENQEDDKEAEPATVTSKDDDAMEGVQSPAAPLAATAEDDEDGDDVGDDDSAVDAATHSTASRTKKAKSSIAPAAIADAFSDSEHYGRSRSRHYHDEASDPASSCPSCGQAAPIYMETLVDPAAEDLLMQDRPHDRANNVSVGKYMFFMMETHLADISLGNKFFVCPYPDCVSRFTVEFELNKHIDQAHLAELQKKLIVASSAVVAASSASSTAPEEPAYAISLECDYAGCQVTFPGTEAGRLERRRHIETEHLHLHRHGCECCGIPVYGSESNESLRHAESSGTPAKRGRGRPRKYPRPGDTSPLFGPDGLPIKRGRGRPRKYPRGGNTDNLSGSELPANGRDEISGSSRRRKRGPGRPRKGSAPLHYAGESSAYSGSDSEMEPSSYSNAESSKYAHRGRSRWLDPQGSYFTRSRSGSPRRGPGRPRKYPRDELGHPIKPSSSSVYGRSPKRRKLSASPVPSPAPASSAPSTPAPSTVAEQQPKSSEPDAVPPVASEESKPPASPQFVAPAKSAPSSAPSSSSSMYKRRGRPPKHPVRGTRINPMEGLTMRQQLKLAAMQAAAKDSGRDERSRLVMSDALVIPPGKMKKPKKGAAAKVTSGGKRIYREANDDDDDDISDDEDDDYDDGSISPGPAPRITPKRQAPVRAKPTPSPSTARASSPPIVVAPPLIPSISNPLAFPLLAATFPSIVEAASDAEKEEVDEPPPPPAAAAPPPPAAGALDLFFGLVDLAASIDSAPPAKTESDPAAVEAPK